MGESTAEESTVAVKPSSDLGASQFDPWLFCRDHKILDALSSNITEAWALEVDPQRRRGLKAVDRENREAVLRAILANLAFASARGSPAVAISLRAAKQASTRYNRAGFRGLRNVVERLAEADSLLNLHRSTIKGVASTISPAPWLAETLQRFPPVARNFGQGLDLETLVLSRADDEGRVDSREIDYRDSGGNADAERYRSELLAINRFLATADLGADLPKTKAVTTCLRALRRRFLLPPDAPEDVVRFDLGGELEGGWWMTLPKSCQHAVRIQSEPPAALSFSSLFLRLAHIEVGLPPPEGDDPYASVKGLSEARWRPGMDRVVEALLLRRSPLLRAPRDARADLPPAVSGPQIRATIFAAFPALAPVLETGAGLRLAFHASQIQVAGLLALADAGIVALPVSQAVMVAGSKADTAARIIEDAAETVTGRRLQANRQLLVQAPL